MLLVMMMSYSQHCAATVSYIPSTWGGKRPMAGPMAAMMRCASLLQ